MSGLGVPLDFYYHIFSGFMIRSILFHVLQHDLDERVVLQIERIKNLQNQCNDDLVLLWWSKQMLLFGSLAGVQKNHLLLCADVLIRPDTKKGDQVDAKN